MTVTDILGKYVGENERNIRDAFEEAEANGQILLFDEADSFFSDRNNATKAWERTLVNEFLTQAEEFSGILICTTNLRKLYSITRNVRLCCNSYTRNFSICLAILLMFV
ncbi:MAG: ATP-binding protein [Treponema sp.]|nr:ATP-binding protein [Treponema sp.]